jgi:hypothetical protein
MSGIRVQCLASTRVLEQARDEHDHEPRAGNEEENDLADNGENPQKEIFGSGAALSSAPTDQIVRGNSQDNIA